jgi:hypothetical protein
VRVYVDPNLKRKTRGQDKQVCASLQLNELHSLLGKVIVQVGGVGWGVLGGYHQVKQPQRYKLYI